MKYYKIVFLLLIGIIFNGNVSGQNNYYDESRFSYSFGQACAKVNNLPNAKYKLAGTQGAFKVGIIGQRDIGGYGVIDRYTTKVPAIIANYGNHFEFLMYTQEIPAIWFNSIESELDDVKEELMDEDEELEIYWGKEGNKIAISAKFYYNNGGSGDVIVYLTHLFRSCQNIVKEILIQMQELRFDRKDELEDSNLEYLSRFDFNILFYDENFEEFADNSINIKEGAYGFNIRDINVGVHNNGNSLDLIYKKFLPSSLNDEIINTILEKTRKYIEDDTPEGYPAVDVFIPQNDEEELWVRLKYKFDKTFTGDDLIDYYETFTDDYIDELDLEVDDIFEEMRDSKLENKLTYLDKLLFQYLIKEDLSEFESKEDSAKEGYWAYTISNKYHYEIYNYGNKLVLSNWIGLPENIEQPKAEKILDEAKEYINKEKAEGSSETFIKWYPGQEYKYIRFKAEYNFDDSLTGQQLVDYYKEYVNNYSEETHDEIEDIIENLK